MERNYIESNHLMVEKRSWKLVLSDGYFKLFNKDGKFEKLFREEAEAIMHSKKKNANSIVVFFPERIQYIVL